MMFLGLHKLGNICCVRNKCCALGQTGKHLCRQQCVLNNVSSFARAFSARTVITLANIERNDNKFLHKCRKRVTVEPCLKATPFILPRRSYSNFILAWTKTQSGIFSFKEPLNLATSLKQLYYCEPLVIILTGLHQIYFLTSCSDSDYVNTKSLFCLLTPCVTTGWMLAWNSYPLWQNCDVIKEAS